MLTERLVQDGYNLHQVRDILIERNYLPKEWALLCFFAVENLYNQSFSPNDIRKFLIEKEKLPTKADKGGVEYWLAQAIIREKVRKNWSLKRIVEFLKYLEFDCQTAALALSVVYPKKIYLWSPDLDLIVINNGEQASEIIDWRSDL
jgi:hypothetical protein